MTSAFYLEHSLNNLENLPVELQRNFTLMRELDSRAQELMRNIDKLTDDYMANIKRYSANKRGEMMIRIQRMYDKVKEYGDDKVQLSIQTYELVDKHIRKLDSDIARFEGNIKDKAINATRNIEETSQKREYKETNDKNITKKGASGGEDTASNKTSKKKQLKKGVAKTTKAAPSKTNVVDKDTNPKTPTNSENNVAEEKSALAGALFDAGVAQSAEVLDMPIDPNEPTFCLCNQVSYGKMIGCDNPDCPIEWFHFECVNLTTKPKGKWFCSKCIGNEKKK